MLIPIATPLKKTESRFIIINPSLLMAQLESRSLQLGFLFWFTALPPLSLAARYPLQQHCNDPDRR